MSVREGREAAKWKADFQGFISNPFDPLMIRELEANGIDAHDARPHVDPNDITALHWFRTPCDRRGQADSCLAERKGGEQESNSEDGTLIATQSLA
jgi:hypothetical protein